ncbi:MAG: PD-(D/E)XK nuclease family protein [Planctomycetota bacterium]|nr:PD-(D/E)XK nuclease family protein [Planctomycetota bacterium]
MSITTAPGDTRVRVNSTDAAAEFLVLDGREAGRGDVDLGLHVERNRDMSTELLSRPPATSTGNPWSYISPSRLNCWLTCPLKWKLKYIDGVKTPPTSSLFLGTIVHAGLQHFYNHRQLGRTLDCSEVIEHIDAHWDPMTDHRTVAPGLERASDNLRDLRK